jgi:nitrogen-specific signal transduction histidine kinase
MKSDISFLLEQAAWPAFIVETSGTIRQANQAAIALFGPKLEGETVSLAAVWEEGPETPEQFLARLDRTAVPVRSMRFRAKGGSALTFATHICPTRETQRRYVFQLMPEPAGAIKPLPEVTAKGDVAAESGAVVAGPRPTVGADVVAVAGAGTGVHSHTQSDAGFIHRQKLDCALHLARTVALDFNNALTSITAHTSLLLALAETEHPWRSALLEVEKAAHKAAEIAQQLATFSRQDKETSRPAANLNTLLRRVVEVLNQAQPDRVSWSIHLEPQLYSAKFDEAKMQQVFIKILENSLEAVRDDGQIAVISSNLELSEPWRDGTAELGPGSYVRVEITDNGSGIAPSILPRVFEPFFTTKHAHRGLGLAWVYGIITNHRGSVCVSSPAEQGTTIRVYLPANRRLVADTGLRLEALRGNQTILMVDDEELLLAMGHVVLGSFGYRVLTANTGARALDVLAKTPYPIDLVITDLVMPQMSGRELVEQLQLRLPGVPILCTSGFARVETTDEDSFLAKPFTSQELLSRVRQILAPRQDVSA